MSIARITEVSSTSKESFDDAIEKGVKKATKTLRNVRSAWVKDQEVHVKDGEISEYRVKMKISFELE